MLRFNRVILCDVCCFDVPSGRFQFLCLIWFRLKFEQQTHSPSVSVYLSLSMYVLCSATGCVCVCITIFSVNNGNDLVPFDSVRDCRRLHNFATFYRFGFVYYSSRFDGRLFLLSVIPVRSLFFPHPYSLLLSLVMAVLFQLFSRLRCENRTNEIRKNTTREKKILWILNVKRIIFALKNCCTKVIEEITRRHATMVTRYTQTPSKKANRKWNNTPKTRRWRKSMYCWKAARKR